MIFIRMVSTNWH